MKRKKAKTVKTKGGAKRVKKAAKKATKSTAKKSIKTKSAPTRRSPAPSPRPDVIDGLVAAQAQALKLPLDPKWREGVKFNLRVILNLSALVDEFALPDDTEPAPVFRA